MSLMFDFVASNILRLHREFVFLTSFLVDIFAAYF
jgi:hypothetical protein